MSSNSQHNNYLFKSRGVRLGNSLLARHSHPERDGNVNTNFRPRTTLSQGRGH